MSEEAALIHAVAIIPGHSEDLLRINLRHLLAVWPPEWRVFIVKTARFDSDFPLRVEWIDLPVPEGGALNHARALSYARYCLGPGSRSNLVLCLDDDVVVLSPAFVTAIVAAFDDPTVGAWGGAGIRDPLHPSCFAIRRELWDRMPEPAFFAELPFHDTLGFAQLYVRGEGFQLRPVPRHRNAFGFDVFGHDAGAPLWAHLGGGAIYGPESGWRQELRRVRARLGSASARHILAGQARRRRWIEMYQG